MRLHCFRAARREHLSMKCSHLHIGDLICKSTFKKYYGKQQDKVYSEFLLPLA